MLGESCRGDATRATLNSTAVCLRAMLRRSPCHRGRVHFDFSEEVVKRLHTSTLRLELTPSFFVSVRLCLSGSHAFTHCLLLSLTTAVTYLSAKYYFKYGSLLAHLSACLRHEFLSLSSGPLSHSDQVSSLVAYLFF